MFTKECTQEGKLVAEWFIFISIKIICLSILIVILVSRLSHHIKSSNIALRNAGLSKNEITNQLNEKKSTATSIVQKFEKTKSVINKRSSGRPKKYTKAGERRLIRILKHNRNQSVKNILVQWNLSLPKNRQISLTIARLIIRK